MNTNTLEYMVAIAREKSITLAAEKLYLSQPVLSKHLRNVEQELGTPIFLRQHSGVELTDAGRIFINNAKLILHLKTELEDDLGVPL